MSEAVKHGGLVEALAAAQGEFPELKKNRTATVYSKRTGKTFTYNYADLADLLSAVRPPLSKHGLALTWQFRYVDGRPHQVTQLHFPGSEPLESPIPILFDSDMQSLGSAITYAKRYGAAGLLGIAAEEDDDGQLATESTQAGDPPRHDQSRNTTDQPPRSAPPASSTPATATKKAVPDLAFFVGKIREKQTAAELLAFLDRCFADAELPKHTKLINDVATAVAGHASELAKSLGITAEEELTVSSRAMFLLDALDMQNATGTAKSPASAPPAETQPKNTLDVIREKIEATITPQELGDKAAKAAEKWPDKPDFLKAVFDLISDLNKRRARDEFKYTIDGTEYQWSQEDREYVSKCCIDALKNAAGTPAESAADIEAPIAPPRTLEEWQKVIDTKQKPEQLMACISDLADNAELAADAERFGQVCDYVAAFIQAHTESEGWGNAAAGLVRQHLLARREVVESKRKVKEQHAN